MKFKHLITVSSVLIALIFPINSIAQPGTMWGNTLLGGTDNLGVIFKANADGTGFSLQKQFLYTSTIKGAGPQGQPILGADGNYYGVTTFGGSHDYGILFKFDPNTSTFTQLHDFGSIGFDGHSPIGSVMQASNGKLYGLTQGGGTMDWGELYEYDPSNGNFSLRHPFGFGNDGQSPAGNMIEAPNGKLYGMTIAGGDHGVGVIYEYNPSTTGYTLMYSFDPSTDGSQPFGDLVKHSNGKLYGMTQYSDNNSGYIFEYVPGTTSITVMAGLDGSTGGNSWGSFTEAGNNKLYALTFAGGTKDFGTLIEFDPATGTVTKKIDFDGASKGKLPFGSLALSTSGTLFGLTSQGGANDLGTLFEFDPATGSFSKRLDLNQSSGSPIYGAPFFKGNGKLYGMNNSGGTNNTGVLYEYDPGAATFTTLLSFGAAGDGKTPANSLVQALNGKLYGTTDDGGTMAYGTIFEMDPANSNFTKKVDFNRQDGWFPNSAMLLASNGKLYGLTQIGGANNHGVIYEFDPPTNTFTKKLDLNGPTTGKESFSGFAEAPNGRLYAVLRAGGQNNDGTLIEYDISSNALAVKHHFDGTNEWSPTSTPILAQNGKLYGVANGGAGTGGVVYEYDPATSIYTKKKDFGTGGETARGPRGSMTLANNGKMYGLSLSGGANNGGALYEFDPASNTLTDKYSFPFQTPTSNGLFGTMTLSTNGKLYGMTEFGGVNNVGIFFEFDPATSTFTKLFEFNGTNGANPARTSMSVLKNSQVITFNPITNKTFGDAPFQPGATSSSGLAVVYTSSNPAVATTNGNTVTIVGAGTTTITARQPGNISYLVAQAVSQTLTVAKAPQTIAFGTISSVTFGEPNGVFTSGGFVLIASTTSGLSMQYATTTPDKIVITTGVPNLSGPVITYLKPGKATIIVSQPGDSNYEPATLRSQTFCINPAKPVVSVASQPNTLTSDNPIGNQWFLQDVAIFQATNQTLVAQQSGNYKVQVTIDGCLSAFSDAKAFAITGDMVGASPPAINVFPNPATDKIIVNLPGSPAKKVISIYHSEGRLQDFIETSEKAATLGISQYSPGLYLIRVADGDQNYFLRFIKQ